MSALRRAFPHARDQRGFGMIELITAMTVMLVGVMSLFALFQAGMLQIRRASTITTAAALADAEMERFRAIKYDTIGLDDAAVEGADGTYRGDTAHKYDAPTTTLAAAVGTSETSLSVSSASGFPTTAPFRIKIDGEILLVTAGAGTTTWTVTRGRDGTAPASHAASTSVALKLRAHLPTCGTSPCTSTLPSRSVTGADGKAYRVDTYITWQTVTNSATPAAGSRMLKLVTIVVRENASPFRAWARISSSFDESTGL